MSEKENGLPQDPEPAASMDFTGERMIPGHVEEDLYQEHIARYIFAEQLARGKNVLDAACGVGYGSQRLSRFAERVTGIDNAPDVIAYACKHYSAANLVFTVGDVTALPFPETAFDLAVAFELIEHLAEPHAFLRELARVLKPNGIAVISTPNRRTYSDAQPGYVNPFHFREYYAEEFSSLLREVFPAVRLLCQNYSPVQTFADAQTDASAGSDLRLVCEPGLKADHEQAQFFMAICGFEEEAFAGALHSMPVVLAGTGNILPEKQRWIHRLQQDILERNAIIGKLQEEFESRTIWAKRCSEDLVKSAGIIRELQKELDSRTAWAKQSADAISIRDAAIRSLQNALCEHAQSAKHLADALALLVPRIPDFQNESPTPPDAGKESTEKSIERLTESPGDSSLV